MLKPLFFLLALFIVFCPGLSAWAALPRSDVLYDGDSLYHHIRVTETGGYRYLSFDRTRGSQSATNIKDPYELKFPYTRAMFLSLAFLDRLPEQVLFVGLGGGSMPKVMGKNLPDVRMDIAEIDADVVKVAKRFFFYEPTEKTRVFIQDGRQFLRRNQNQYDIIFLDAYNNDAVPFHLTTKEFFEIVKQRLKPDGIAVANVWGPRSNEFYTSQVKTYQTVFTKLFLLDAITSNNYIFIATANNQEMTQMELNRRAGILKEKVPFPFSIREFVRTFEDLTTMEVNADVLLDDFAPVELLRSRRTDTN
jgi:spermidine synthase